MIQLYRLQQRLSITRYESLAVLTLMALFVTGLTVRHVQEQQVPPLTTDSLVAQPSAPSPAPDSHASNAPPTPSTENPINVNTASSEALQELPGIGPALSKRIQRYRENKRPFQRAKELKRVSGIGPKTLSSIRPMVHVSSPDSSAG